MDDGLAQLQPQRPLTRPELDPAEQLDAQLRYMAEGYLRAAEQLGAQLAAFGRAMAEGLALVGAPRRVGTDRGDPTGDPPLEVRRG